MQGMIWWFEDKWYSNFVWNSNCEPNEWKKNNEKLYEQIVYRMRKTLAQRKKLKQKIEKISKNSNVSYSSRKNNNEN